MEDDKEEDIMPSPPSAMSLSKQTKKLDDDEFDDEESNHEEAHREGPEARGSSSAADALRGSSSGADALGGDERGDGETTFKWPSIPTYEPTSNLTDTHMYVIAYFPAHKQYLPLHGLTSSLGTLEDETGALWAAITACTSIAETRELLMSRAPADFYRHGDQILRNKALALGNLRAVSRVPRRELPDFTISPLPLVRGCVLLSGVSGIGKTCFAEAHGQHPFVIRTLDQCKDIPIECDLLVFDDMRFDSGGLDLKPEDMLALLTADRETSIKCRHFDGLIPAIPRIFTTNLESDGGPKAFPSGANKEQQTALDRRVFKTPYLRKRLFLTANHEVKVTHTTNSEENRWSNDPSNVALW